MLLCIVRRTSRRCWLQEASLPVGRVCNVIFRRKKKYIGTFWLDAQVWRKRAIVVMVPFTLIQTMSDVEICLSLEVILNHNVSSKSRGSYRC